MLGGIALQLDDSIHVGDWLQLPSGQQGKVKAIRWRHTVVETRNWDTVIVPNSALLNDNIVILGEREDQPTQHRMWVYFNVDFRYSPEEVINVVEDALQSTIDGLRGLTIGFLVGCGVGRNRGQAQEHTQTQDRC